MNLIEKEPLHLFRAGSYGAKGTYTAADLEGIASRYNASQKSADPQDRKPAPLKFDHKDEGPAAGFFRELFVRGDNLYGVPLMVPEQIERIKSEGWHNRSVEFSKGKDGKYELRAVALLGAARPEIGGLEPARFDEATGDELIAFCGSEMIAPAPFSIPETDPFPGSHGTIVDEVETAAMLGHSHIVYLDAQGRGFTSPPFVRGPYGAATPVGGDSHIHKIEGREIAPAGAVPHIHNFAIEGTYRKYGEEKPAPEPKAPETKNNPPKENKKMSSTVEDLTVAQFTENKMQLERTKAENEALRRRAEMAEAELAAKANSDKIRKFGDFWGRIRETGKVPASLEGRASLIFDQLGDNAVKFSEGGEEKVSSGQDLFIQFCNALPGDPGKLRTAIGTSPDNPAFMEGGKGKGAKKMGKKAYFAEMMKRGEEKMKAAGSDNKARYFAEAEAEMIAEGITQVEDGVPTDTEE